MNNLLSEDEKKINKSLNEAGGTHSGWVISENDDNDEVGNATIFDEVECPSYNVHFVSDSSYQKHLPCKPE